MKSMKRIITSAMAVCAVALATFCVSAPMATAATLPMGASLIAAAPVAESSVVSKHIAATVEQKAIDVGISHQASIEPKPGRPARPMIVSSDESNHGEFQPHRIDADREAEGRTSI